MNVPRKDYSVRYEEIMHNAGEKRRMLAARALDFERRYRERRKLHRTHSDHSRLQQLDAIKAKLEFELQRLNQKLQFMDNPDERIMVRAEIAHFERALNHLNRSGPRRRKPPESGIAVPAVPPNGPLPKQGGAEAPLEFGN